jgi:FkbM family methyltransferase
MLSNIRKKVFNAFPLLSHLRTEILTKQTIAQFKDIGIDFEITKAGNKNIIHFNNNLGYLLPDLKASFSFNNSAKFYDVAVNGKHISTHTFPLPEIVRELRGYLLAGPPLPDRAIIDIGASNGFLTMAIASMVNPDTPVFAFEPDKISRRMFLRNMETNSFKNISISHQCIYRKSGIFGFVSTGDGSASLTENPGNGETVEAITLKEFLRSQQLTTNDIGFMKMDIEGAEIDLLDDIFEVVNTNSSCVIAIASYHKVNNELTSAIIEREALSHPDIFIKTLYPYHRTTFITNKHSIFAKNLSRYK